MENTLMSITKKYVTQMKGPERTWIPCCSCNTLFHAVVNLSHKTLIQRLRFVLLVFTQFDLNHLFMIGRLTRLTTSWCYTGNLLPEIHRVPYFSCSFSRLYKVTLHKDVYGWVLITLSHISLSYLYDIFLSYDTSIVKFFTFSLFPRYISISATPLLSLWFCFSNYGQWFY